MKEVDQTVMGTAANNSLSACVASLLEVSIDALPNFAVMNALSETISAYGLRLLELMYPSTRWVGWFTEEDHAIAIIKSPHGDWDHHVVANLVTGKVVWDPHPQGFVGGDQLEGDQMIGWRVMVKVGGSGVRVRGSGTLEGTLPCGHDVKWLDTLRMDDKPQHTYCTKCWNV